MVYISSSSWKVGLRPLQGQVKTGPGVLDARYPCQEGRATFESGQQAFMGTSESLQALMESLSVFYDQVKFQSLCTVYSQSSTELKCPELLRESSSSEACVGRACRHCRPRTSARKALYSALHIIVTAFSAYLPAKPERFAGLNLQLSRRKHPTRNPKP